MKQIEMHISFPSKLHWEFAIVPNINFGYVNGYYFIAFAWLLWHIIIIIKRLK